MKRIIITVYGRVQGVFFRHTALIRAEELGLTGWTRNEADGSVSILAEGEEEALKTFLEWCRKGPPLAIVDNADAKWQEATGQFRGFEIA